MSALGLLGLRRHPRQQQARDHAVGQPDGANFAVLVDVLTGLDHQRHAPVAASPAGARARVPVRQGRLSEDGGHIGQLRLFVLPEGDGPVQLAYLVDLACRHGRECRMVPILCVGGRLSTHILPTRARPEPLVRPHRLPTHQRISCRPPRSLPQVRGLICRRPVVLSPIQNTPIASDDWLWKGQKADHFGSHDGRCTAAASALSVSLALSGRGEASGPDPPGPRSENCSSAYLTAGHGHAAGLATGSRQVA
jgi:hypothetical protein